MKAFRIALTSTVAALTFLLLFPVQGDSRGDFGAFGNHVPSDSNWFPLVVAAAAGVAVWFALGRRRGP